ncbi:uncharacterized protein EV420DRAFT_1488711 [Desarmillaria tabescens]|uniref:Uncharacterized protein n=1 Tax=Armillaria tabescens TaxID=1929756 RepID=A0AA39MHA3_ARMTA|nr:uncharacterized protein EV420DRAFT_1488711 [Desarmillaria tabescens]KAK0434267.1 hypothetical protein EV420DRAFT_1488711 [Desarmillaria tabescens]
MVSHAASTEGYLEINNLHRRTGNSTRYLQTLAGLTMSNDEKGIYLGGCSETLMRMLELDWSPEGIAPGVTCRAIKQYTEEGSGRYDVACSANRLAVQGRRHKDVTEEIRRVWRHLNQGDRSSMESIERVEREGVASMQTISVKDWKVTVADRIGNIKVGNLALATFLVKRYAILGVLKIGPWMLNNATALFLPPRQELYVCDPNLSLDSCHFKSYCIRTLGGS